MNKKNLILAVAAVGLVGTLSVPLFASAQTTTLSDLQAQVKALLVQLASLQAQIHQVEASSTSMGDGEGHKDGMSNGSSTMPICISFNRNLSIGSEGSDVSDLQRTLAQDPDVYPSGTITGFFGPLTAKAVILFQKKNGISSSSTGFVGSLTRDFFMRRCGGPGPVKLPPPFMNGSSSASGTPPLYPMMPPHPGDHNSSGTDR